MEKIGAKTMSCGVLVFAALCLPTGTSVAQSQGAPEPAPKCPGYYYLEVCALPLAPLLLPAPAPDSKATEDDLAELHRLETSRTLAQIKAAKEDDIEEDIFIYRTVLGTTFRAEALPVMTAFQGHVVGEAATGAGVLKDFFLRTRPYKADPTLHPVCGLTSGRNSYPSGHTVVGYLTGLALAEMVPERQSEILARAADYAHNRVVCGVHYPTDVEAAHQAAYALFGELMASPKFLVDLKAARKELRAFLKLPPVAD